MAGNASFDTILATTLKNYDKTLIDNVFNSNPFLYWLKAKNRIKMKSGGQSIVIPLMYADNSTVNTYSGYDTLDITPQEGISAAEYSWKQMAGSIAISGIEEAQNSGEEEVIDLLEAKVFQCEESIMAYMSTMFHGAGGGNGGKDWLSLQQLVAASGIIGGIDSGTETWWRSTVDTDDEVLTIADAIHNYNSVSRGGSDKPDFALTDQTLYEKYESLLQPQQRFTDPKTAEAGFANLMFRGATLMWDPNTEAGSWYNLNSKYLWLVGHTQKWFKRTPFVVPENQDARYAQILTYGNLATSNRSRQGKLEDKTA